MAKSKRITLSQYTSLVGYGYDGDVIRNWTRHRAKLDLDKKKQLEKSLRRDRSGDACTKDGIGNTTETSSGMPNDKVHLPLASKTIQLSNALAAGLDPAAAQFLIQSTTRHEGNAESGMTGVNTRDPRLRSICLSVLSAVGLGAFDSSVLNHYIRDVLRRLLSDPLDERKRSQSRKHITSRLNKLMAKETFEQLAMSALKRHRLAFSTPKQSAKRTQIAYDITRRWIEDGGWRVFWFAMNFMNHTRNLGNEECERFGVNTIQQGLEMSLGFVKLPDLKDDPSDSDEVFES